MQELLYIPVIEGTSRPNRLSIHVARLVESIGKKRGDIKTEIVDPASLHFILDGRDKDTTDPTYTEITKQADGFFIVTPEYNHSYPGSLKRMLDSEFKNYKNKAVAFAGVSDGYMGGVRAIQALLPIVRKMGMWAVSTDVYFPFVQNLFDENGNLLDSQYEKRIARLFDKLVWTAGVLKRARQELEFSRAS